MTDGRQPQPLQRLLICEGAEDKYFFERLIEVHALPRFYIQDAGGNGRFAAAIRRFQVERTRDYNSLLEILVVADNDEDPAASFRNVCTQIHRIFGIQPSSPLQKAPRTATRAAITVMMVPWEGENGNLERMCLEAARSVDRVLAGHVDTFMNLIHAERWGNESRLGKAWLRTNLAARCVRDPFVALGHVFNDPQYQPLIPVNHSSFGRLVGFLRTV